MKNLFKSNYFKIFLTIIFSFTVIKMIDNYKISLDNIQKLVTMITPFIIGGVLAFFLNYSIHFLEDKMKIKKRWISVLITYGLLMLFIIGSISYLIPNLIDSAKDLVKDIPQYISQSESFIKNNLDTSMFANDLVSEKIKEVIPTVLNLFNDLLNKLLSTTLSFGKFIFNMVIGIIVSIYILIDKEGFKKACKRLSTFIIGNKSTNTLVNVVREIKENIGTYIIAKTLESFVLGIVSGIGYYLLGSKYALLFGFIAGVTNMIPFYGPIIGAIPVIVFNLFVSIKVSVCCLVFAIIVQQIEGNILEPMLIGNKMGVPPFLTLLSITIGGGLFGVVGMILAVPITAVIKNNLLRKIEEKEREIIKEKINNQEETNLA